MNIFDLQMFANPNTQTTGTSTLSAEMKTYYDTELIEMAGPNLVHAQFGLKKSIPANGGKKIEWRKFSNFAKATTPLTEGVTPDGVGMTVTPVDVTLDQYGAYTTISDVLDLTAIDDIVLQATDKHGANAGLTLDTVTRNELMKGTHVMRAGAKGSRSALTSTDIITGELVAKAATFLKKQNAPKINGSYVAIVHPSVAYDLRRDPEWLEAHKYSATKEIFEGEIGELHGVRFIESTEAKIWNDPSEDDTPSGLAVYGCLFLGKEAYGVVDITGGGTEVIIKQKGSAGTADPLDQRSTVGWKSMYAAKILIPEYILRVEVCSSYSAIDSAN
jgi:N4-gp56 family major capsid protein